MIDARFVPIEKWPGKATPYYDRKDAPFRAVYSNTLDLLEKELNQLRAKDVTIQAYFERRDIRNDGWPKSSARPTQPGVVVGFDIREIRWNAKTQKYMDELLKTMSFPCDRFKSWEDNLRAIALALEALRKIDRYGVTQSGEQYQGWARLAAPGEPGEMSREEALEVLSPVPTRATGPDGVREFYRLDVTALNAVQRMRLVRFLAERWKQPVDQVMATIDDPEHGVPILAQDVIVAVPMRLFQ